MPRRPDVFNQEHLAQTLRQSGCPESCIAPTISNFRLFVPLLFASIDPDTMLDIMKRAQVELGLSAQLSAWRASLKYLATWAEQEIEAYKVRRSIAPTGDAERHDGNQLRLL